MSQHLLISNFTSALGAEGRTIAAKRFFLREETATVSITELR